MNRLWNWAGNAVSYVIAVGSAIKKTLISGGSTAVSIVVPPVAKTLRGFLNYFAFSDIITVMENKKTREIVWPALQANLLYMTLAVVIEGGGKIIEGNIPLTENPAIDVSARTALWLVNSAAFMYLLYKAANMYAVNTFNNAAASKRICDEFPSTSHPRICNDGPMAQFQANLASGIYYMGNMGSVIVAELVADRYIPYVGSYAVLPYRTLVYGNALVEYKLSAIGACTPCRYKYLNGYEALGWGMALTASYELLKFLFARYLGMENSFLADALFNVLFQCGMVASLMNAKPVTNQGGSLDVTLPARIAVEAWISRTCAYITELYNRPGPGVDVKQVLQRVRRVPGVDNFVTRPSFRRAYDMYEKPSVEYVDWLEGLRKDPVKNKFPLFSDYLPASWMPYGYTRDQINLAFDKRWDEIIHYFRDFVRYVREKNGKLNRQYNNTLMAEVLRLHGAAPAVPAIQLKQKDDQAKSAVRNDPEKYLATEPPAPAALPLPKDNAQANGAVRANEPNRQAPRVSLGKYMNTDEPTSMTSRLSSSSGLFGRKDDQDRLSRSSTSPMGKALTPTLSLPVLKASRPPV